MPATGRSRKSSRWPGTTSTMPSASSSVRPSSRAATLPPGPNTTRRGTPGTRRARQVAVLEQELRGLLADLAGDPEIPVDRHPTYLEAEAERDQAALDLQHATVTAPFAGVASKKPYLGDYVTAGAPVMSIIA